MTHFVPSAASPAFDPLPVYPIRVAFLPCADDAGNKMFVTELTARPTSEQGGAEEISFCDADVQWVMRDPLDFH
ncbi:MAG: hypothetical protein AB8B97_12110 [Granulosicoccus sp.]